MNTAYSTTPYNPASNATRIPHAPMPPGYPQFGMPSQLPPQQPFPYMLMPALMQQQQQFQLQNSFPMYPFATHNFAPMPFQQQFFHLNQLPAASSPKPALPQPHIRPACATPTTSRLNNNSLNTSLPAGSLSFNESHRFNPLSGRSSHRSRDHSLLIDQNTSSSDLSLQQSTIDPHVMANNNDLINYCVIELSKKRLTEQELIAKVSKSRRFKNFGKHCLPIAISIILNSFPCFVSRTVILRTGANDLQPISKTLWQSDKRYQRSRGNKLNLTMHEIPERNTGSGEILSVLGDIATLNLDENRPPTSIASVEKILEGIKV